METGGILSNTTGRLTRCNAPEFDTADTHEGSLLHFVRTPSQVRQHSGGFTQVSVGTSRICALGADQRLLCWGASKVSQMSRNCKAQQKASVAEAVQCMPCKSGAGQKATISFSFRASAERQWGVLQCHPSCATCDASNSATSCTSCHGTPQRSKSNPAHWAPCEGGKACHHTILDAQRRAGTCSVEHCHLCKPRSCCGPHHRHLLVDAASMRGVCVRHTDACAEHCVSGADGNTKACSKGCNMLTKHRGGKAVSVCQAEKITLCPAGKMRPGIGLLVDNKHKKHRVVELGEGAPDTALFTSGIFTMDLRQGKVKCETQKRVNCKAHCTLREPSPELDQVGPSCILSVIGHRSCFRDGSLVQSVACAEVGSTCKQDGINGEALGRLAKDILHTDSCKESCPASHCEDLGGVF